MEKQIIEVFKMLKKDVENNNKVGYLQGEFESDLFDVEIMPMSDYYVFYDYKDSVAIKISIDDIKNKSTKELSKLYYQEWYYTPCNS